MKCHPCWKLLWSGKYRTERATSSVREACSFVAERARLLCGNPDTRSTAPLANETVTNAGPSAPYVLRGTGRTDARRACSNVMIDFVLYVG